MSRRDFIGAAIGALVLATVLLACQAQAEPPPPKSKVVTERIGRTSRSTIYTFKQGANRCYIVERDFDSTSVDCLREEP